MKNNMDENILINYDGAKEVFDPRDYTLEEYGGTTSEIELPDRIILEKAPNLNQLSSSSCTVTGGLNVSNETHIQKLPDYVIRKDWDILWEEAKKRGASERSGWYLNSALAMLKDFNIIGGYIKIGQSGTPNHEEIKKQIASGKAVYTGLPIGNWRRTKDNHEYSLDGVTLSGHAFDITGYDVNYKCKDGTTGAYFVGNSWGQDGYFWLPFSVCIHLFSQYVFDFDSNSEKLTQLRKKRKNEYLQKAFEKKIWNEERAEDMASETEIRIIINRALGLPDDYKFFRKHFAILLEDKIIKEKIIIWNNERPYDFIADNEIALMFTRAVTRNTQLNTLVLSREQVAEVIGRDFL